MLTLPESQYRCSAVLARVRLVEMHDVAVRVRIYADQAKSTLPYRAVRPAGRIPTQHRQQWAC